MYCAEVLALYRIQNGQMCMIILQQVDEIFSKMGIILDLVLIL